MEPVLLSRPARGSPASTRPMAAAPPPNSNAGAPCLISMRLSHFVEKARWALERYGIPFIEEPHVPGAHRWATRRAGGAGPVPCLRLASGAGVVDGSQPILRWVDARRGPTQPPLFPPETDAEVARLCELFDTKLGPAARVYVYSHLLYTKEIAEAMAAPPAPWVERAALRLGGWLILRRLMASGMRISEDRGQVALKRVQGVFAEVDGLLADGRPYLVDRAQALTAADLAFAALAAPALGQPYAVAPGLGESTPPKMREEVEALRATLAGQFALRIWKERGVVLS